MQDRYIPPQNEVSHGQVELEENAKKAMEAAGFKPETARFIPEGRQHNIFDVTLSDGSAVIARFEKDSTGPRRDSQFNGPLSLERERNLMNLVREHDLPAPNVHGLYETEEGRFLLVEKMPGVHWSEYMENNKHSKEAYLRSLRGLGLDLAEAHAIKFRGFGNVMSEHEIEPPNIQDFYSRVELITKLRLDRALNSNAIPPRELNQIAGYLRGESELLEELLNENPQTPVLVLTDLHPMNFFVDESGRPSGFFDLEASQAGYPALEIYNLRTHILNYYEFVSTQAESALLEGYRQGGGMYDPHNPTNQQLERVLGVGYLVAAVSAYKNSKDGLRDTWSEQFQNILYDAMRIHEVNYSAISQVFRSKTQQPQFAAQP